MNEFLSSFHKNRQQSRKIKSFLWMVVSVLALVALATKIGTPENVTIQALWVVAAGGLFTIGGQALVDALGKLAEKKQGQ